MSARRDHAGDSEPLTPSRTHAIGKQGLLSLVLRATLLLVLFTTVALATRAPFLQAGFLNVDEASHLLGAWELLRGGRLYVDFADNKPPLVYAFYAAAQALFGEGLSSVRLLSALTLLPMTALGAAAFFGYGRRGLSAGLAFLIASATFLASDAHAVHCEHVMLLPLAWSLVILRSPGVVRRPWGLFGAGVLLGLATLGKQPAALCLPAYLAWVLLLSRRASMRPLRTAFHGAALGAGFLVPLGLSAAFFARQGSLGEAVFWIWKFNLSHIDNPMPPRDVAAHVARMGGLVLPAAIPLGIASFRARETGASSPRRQLSLLFLAAAFLPAWLGLRLFGHYFLPAIFGLSLMAAPFLGARKPLRWRVPCIGFLAFALVAITLASRIVHDPAHALADVAQPAYERIGEAIRADDCGPDEELFVWGYAPTVYAFAGERPASRFVVPVDSLTGYLAGNEAAEEGRIDTRGRISETHWHELMADLESRRPAHLVDTAPADLNHWGRFSMDRFPALLAFVRRDYHVLGVVDGAVLYRKNDCPARRSAAAQ